MDENPHHDQRPQAAASVKRGTAAAWGQLLRLPNLLTVPGDPLAGFLVSACVLPSMTVPFCRVLAAGAASLFLYAAGLVLNDICDLKEDRRERPDRPLPSGRIGIGSAWLAFGLLALAGLALAALASWASLAVAVALVIAVAAYNGPAKRLPVIGPLTMGLCRGLSLLLGAAVGVWAYWEPFIQCFYVNALSSWDALMAATGVAMGVGMVVTPEQPPVLVAAVGMTLYIAAVTQIARGETRRRELGFLRRLPGVVLVLWFAVTDVVIWPRGTGELFAFNVLGVLAVAWAVHCGVTLKGAPEPVQVQRAVGGFIRGLLLIQAALAALVAWPGWIVAAVLLACWPIQAYLAKRFYSS